MSIHILEAVQRKLNLPGLVKVTPDKGVTPQQTLPRPALHQVALVTVAAALYKLTRTSEGVVRLLLSGKNDNWLDLPGALGTTLPDVVAKVSEYGGSDEGSTEALMRKFADTLLLVLHEQLANNVNPDSVHEFMSGQRHHILVYVPADLKLGKMLNDSTWDDQTNHMEGPVSNFLHKIENLMS
ncbi:hypothetical protein [Sediminibacterium soli]|uniref:hypothetical protein n=1 Tax=Sediminibacterium soli TaxID=2698829 RepID=UPI00137B8C5A|nr:hypothetical protein [Sediminibacterium soli]NCI45875.1 hypothetical protein [Sediminibacterium soli]